MKVLLIGSEGFIGRYFKKALHYEYVSYDLKFGEDIRDKFRLHLLFENEHFDLVINLAAKTGVKLGERYPDEYFTTNVLGLKNIIDLCKEYNVRLIHYSSSSVFRSQKRPVKEDDVKEPLSVYGITKLAGELLIKKSGINWTIIRPFTVLGGVGRPGMIMDRWKGQILRKEPVTFYGDGTTARGYTYIDDLVQATFQATQGDFNIGGDQVVTLEDMWNIFHEVHPEATRIKLPLPSYDNPWSVADTSKAKDSFGWSPHTDIKEKIKSWIR